jgi:dihydrodipicolinate synthase/N-acetylneuraminate lyase
MAQIPLICRTATTFTAGQALDEDALAEFLCRLVDAGLGVYLASGGSGEGHALTPPEIRRVYDIGVSVGKGKVPVNANPPEQHTPRAMIEQAEIAIAAGVDVINIYGPTVLHGYRPTPAEITAYFDEVLASVAAPVAIAPNPVMGYTPAARVMADVADRHHQVVAINLSGLGNGYFVELMDALSRDVPVYVPFDGSLYTLPLGAAGLLGAEANIIPQTVRRYIDLHQGDPAELAAVYADLLRFSAFARQWYGATPRWIKLAMRVLGLPGGSGGLRAPYRMPSQDVIDRFSAGLLALGIAEIDELAAAARSAPAGS